MEKKKEKVRNDLFVRNVCPQLREMLGAAAKMKGTHMGPYLTEALLEKFERDGIKFKLVKEEV